MTASPDEVLVPLGAAVLCVGAWISAWRTRYGAHLTRVIIANRTLPLPLRLGPLIGPFLAGEAICLAVLFGLPNGTGWYAFYVMCPLLALTIALNYRPPRWLLPQWLRDEIDRGLTALPRPDRLDWLFFWIAVPVLIIFTLLLPVAIPILQAG